MKIKIHGAAGGEVTGSAYLVQTDQANILIDCGMFQGLKDLRERNWQEPPFDPRLLDAVLITHAHIDHTGYLPRLVRQGFKGPVYCSRGTADLLKILLIKSMNDVARCLARDNAGSIEAFAAKMNAKAREIGMRNSRFANPNGLTEPNQYSTARDMARLALFAYRNRIIRGIVSHKTITWRSVSVQTA